jgi:hypothetical protein
MNKQEEDLQKNIEAGVNLPADDINTKAYLHVFDALKKEPEYKLSANFAESVTARIKAKNQRGLSGDIFWFGVGIILVIISGAVAIAYSGFKPDLGFLSGAASFKGVLIFGAVFIIALNWIDRNFIRKQQTNID